MALSSNKQKEKTWTELIKQEAKKYGWKFKSFFAYKGVKGFFYEVNFSPYGHSNYISGSFSFKPLIIDEIFWEITSLQENKKIPLSLRGNGAFVISSKNVFSFKIEVVPDNLTLDIDGLFKRINLKIEELQFGINDLGDFISYVKKHPNKSSEWFDVDMLIVGSISQKNYDEALSLSQYASEKREMGGWGFDGKSFYDLAIEYAQARK